MAKRMQSTTVETKEFLRELSSETTTNKRFQHVRTDQTFVIENLEAAEDPVKILRQCFQECIDRTLEKSREAGMESDQIGVIISSELLAYDIWTPIRPVNENTVDAILNTFLKVMQSKTQEGNLYGEPFSVAVTGFKSEALPKQRRTIGRGKRRFIHKIRRNVNNASVIEIHNDDQYCLFYAIELMRIYTSKEMPHQQFSEYKRNFKRQEAIIKQIMRKAKIPRDLPEYSIEEWGPHVQAFYDREYGAGKYKIFVFNASNVKPIYTSQTSSYTHPILLYHHDQHFDGIRTMSSFMGSRYYCLHCETTFSNHNSHFMHCKAGCVNCGEHGIGFPCENIDPEGRFWAGCSKTFYNDNCFRRHATNNCRQFKKCLDCGVIWNVSNMYRRGRKGHECGARFCIACHNYHIKGKCYIQPYEIRPRKPYRIISYDFESQQFRQREDNKKKHVVNFICAKIICTECITNGNWNRPLQQPCDICGGYRTRTWAPFKFSQTQTDCHIRTDSPLTDFTAWLLNLGDQIDDCDLDPEYKSICFAHFVSINLKTNNCFFPFLLRLFCLGRPL